MSKEKTALDAPLPHDMWTLPDGAIQNEHLQLLFAELVARLREEAETTPGFGTVEMMIVERLAFIYISMRDRESHPIGQKGGFEHERNYRETVKDWMAMATQFQKAKGQATDAEAVRKHIHGVVKDLIRKAIDGLPAEIQPTVAEAMAGALETSTF